MNTSLGDFNGGNGVRSPTQNRNRAAPNTAQQFSEGNLYKQVVTFQSGRGKIFNDAAIMKNSINQVQRRSDRANFMRDRMEATNT